MWSSDGDSFIKISDYRWLRASRIETVYMQDGRVKVSMFNGEVHVASNARTMKQLVDLAMGKEGAK